MPEPLLWVVGLAVFAFHLWALIEALMTPVPVWQDSRLNQVGWVAVVLLVPIVGPLLYLLIARPRLRSLGRPPAV